MQLLRYASLLALPLLVLAGCETTHRFFAFHHKHALPSVSASVPAEQYVLNTALAQLALMPPEGSLHAALPYVKKLGIRKKVKNLYSLTVIAMAYKTPSAEKFTLLAPAPLTSAASDFKPLKTLLRHLATKPHTLQDIRIYLIAFTPERTSFSRTDPRVLRRQLSDLQMQMLSGNDTLEPFDDATLDLKLVRVFMECHARDAAYMALENAKNALAQATAQSADQTRITELSHEADELENQLHKEMPYTL